MGLLDSKYEIYRSDASDDQIIKIINRSLKDHQHEYLIDLIILSEEKKALLRIINEYFKKGNENPFKSLAADINLKDSVLGFSFLWCLDSYINFFCEHKEKKWLNKLKNENKIDFEAIKKIEFDFDTLLNFYINFKFKRFRHGLFGPFAFMVNEIKEINYILSSHLTKDSVYNTFLEALKKNKHALDNEFLHVLYISAYSFLPYNKQKANQILNLYLKENQKINFEFIALACGCFELDETAKNKLMEHFDFAGYKCDVYLDGNEEENAMSIITDYIRTRPELSEKFIQKPLDDLKSIENEVKEIKKITPTKLKEIKKNLRRIIKSLPIIEYEKCELLGTVRNIKLISGKKYILKLIKAIFKIISVFKNKEGIKEFKELNLKNKILPVVNKIKKPLDGRDLT